MSLMKIGTEILVGMLLASPFLSLRTVPVTYTPIEYRFLDKKMSEAIVTTHGSDPVIPSPPRGYVVESGTKITPGEKNIVNLKVAPVPTKVNRKKPAPSKVNREKPAPSKAVPESTKSNPKEKTKTNRDSVPNTGASQNK